MTSVVMALAFGLAAPSVVWPQQPAAPAKQESAPLAEQPPPPAVAQPAPGNPGFIEEVGKFLKNSATGLSDSASGLTSKLPSARDTLDGINSGAKNATDTLTKITPSISAQSMVSGRVICPVAGNGAPDCKSASDDLCKQKGYKEGKSIDIQTAQKCSARAYLNGESGACRTENFVTRALCQ